jgi:hypothetical protein
MISKSGPSPKQMGILSPGKIAVYVSIITCVVIFFLLPDANLDGFLKGRITSALKESYPAYSIYITRLHYKIWENRIECDSVVLTKIDSTVSCRVAWLSMNGIGRFKFLVGRGLAAENLLSSDFGAEDIVLTFPRSQYELRCDRLHASVPDSEIVIDGLDLHPLADDRHFFAGSTFRRTRFHLVIPHCSLMGSACLSIMEGKIRCARAVEVQGALLDVLINKDKPSAIDTSTPLMPNELFFAIANTIQLDSVNCLNGTLLYGESFEPDAKPALLTVDRLQILAEGAANRLYHHDTIVIRAVGRLMKAGTIEAVIAIPVASPELTFHYAGSLSGMDICALNPWLETADKKRFKTGSLESALFDVQVVAGSASGTVRAAYKDLKIVAIDGRTGSESGLVNSILSFIANNLKLRTTNLPDNDGAMKIGQIKYVHARGEPFFTFAWFAVRSGLGDLIGF